jgi:hypothetical protein
VTQRKIIPFNGNKIFGPFPTGDAIAAVGMPTMISLCQNHAIYWADAGKSLYWSFQEVGKRHTEGVPWMYSAPSNTDPVIAQHGRVKIYGYEGLFVAFDTFNKESYISKTLRGVFEMAVAIVYNFPNDRVVPIPTHGKKYILPRGTQAVAGGGHVTSDELSKVWSDGGIEHVAERPVLLHLSDAIAILAGQQPSDLFVSRVADAFPQALVSAQGAALIGYDTKTTRLRVGRSLSMFAMVAEVAVSDAIESFATDYSVGDYAIVGGWALDELVKHKDDRRMLATINMALDTASSPTSLSALVSTLYGVL